MQRVATATADYLSTFSPAFRQSVSFLRKPEFGTFNKEGFTQGCPSVCGGCCCHDKRYVFHILEFRFFLISVSQPFTLLHDLSIHCSQCSYSSECAKLHPMPCLRCGKLSHTVSACTLAAPSQNRGMYSCGICVPDNQFVLYLSCPPSSPYFLLFHFSPS